MLSANVILYVWKLKKMFRYELLMKKQNMPLWLNRSNIRYMYKGIYHHFFYCEQLKCTFVLCNLLLNKFWSLQHLKILICKVVNKYCA